MDEPAQNLPIQHSLISDIMEIVEIIEITEIIEVIKPSNVRRSVRDLAQLLSVLSALPVWPFVISAGCAASEEAICDKSRNQQDWVFSCNCSHLPIFRCSDFSLFWIWDASFHRIP